MYLSGRVELGLLEKRPLWVVDVSRLIDMGIEGDICSRVLDVDSLCVADMEVTYSMTGLQVRTGPQI